MAVFFPSYALMLLFFCVCVFLQESLLDADHHVAVALGPANTPGSSVRTELLRFQVLSFAHPLFPSSSPKCFESVPVSFLSVVMKARLKNHRRK